MQTKKIISCEHDQIKSDLRAHFGTCGEVSRIVLPQDRESGVFKGYATLLSRVGE